MKRTILRKDVVPFLLMFALLLVATFIADRLLHQFELVWIGRYLGITGTLLIVLSFLYSMRKRKLVRFGKPKTLLTLHETLTWLGSLMVLIHAGVHFNAILPWLATAAMLVNVVSGLTGKFVLDRSRRRLASKKEELLKGGMTEDRVEKEMFWDAVTVDLMKKWRTVHLPITLIFGVLGIAHILSIFLFWQWK